MVGGLGTRTQSPPKRRGRATSWTAAAWLSGESVVTTSREATAHVEGWRPQTRSTALQLQALVQAACEEHAEHLHTGDAQAHGPADPQVLLDEGLQLGDTAAPTL